MAPNPKESSFPLFVFFSFDSRRGFVILPPFGSKGEGVSTSQRLLLLLRIIHHPGSLFHLCGSYPSKGLGPPLGPERWLALRVVSRTGGGAEATALDLAMAAASDLARARFWSRLSLQQRKSRPATVTAMTTARKMPTTAPDVVMPSLRYMQMLLPELSVMHRLPCAHTIVLDMVFWQSFMLLVLHVLISTSDSVEHGDGDDSAPVLVVVAWRRYRSGA